MAKKELFTVRNDLWKISEQSDGSFSLSSADTEHEMKKVNSQKLRALLAVVNEADRYIRENAGR